MPRKIVQLIPAAAGWSVVTRIWTDRKDTCRFLSYDVPCFALVEEEDGTQHVVPMTSLEDAGIGFLEEDDSVLHHCDLVGPMESISDAGYRIPRAESDED